MKSLSDIEKQIAYLYDEFYESVGIDKETGQVKGTNKMFSGAPFIGSLYPMVKRKILFVGLDIGSDEGFHTFESRRKVISHSANGESEIPAEEPFNAHIAGTYAMAFALLYDVIGKKDTWLKFSSDENETAYRAIQKYHSDIPVELLDYICLTNAHKFVTIDREDKGGAQDRMWNEVVSKAKELNLLKDEISILEPEIIIFQGVQFDSIISELHLKDSIKGIVTYHPSTRDRYHKSIRYFTEVAQKIK